MATRGLGSGVPRRTFSVLPAEPPTVSESNPHHDHRQESVAKIAAHFIDDLFACPEYPQASCQPQAKLPYFIAYALHRTKLHSAVTFSALVLLQRLKARFPSARGSSGHKLFITALMISSKVMCDDTYSNKSWCIAAQSMFTLREINQMEREMCQYLDWELTVDPATLSTFETALKDDFRAHGSRRPQNLSFSRCSNSGSQNYPVHPLSPNIFRRRLPDESVDPAIGKIGSVSLYPQTDFHCGEEDIEAGRGYDAVPEGSKPRRATLASLGFHLVSLFFAREKDRPPLHDIPLPFSNDTGREREVRAMAPDGGATSSTVPGIFSHSQNTSISGGTFSVIHQTIESDPSVRKSVKHIVYLLSIQTAMLF